MRQEWWDARMKPGTHCLPIRRQVSALTSLAARCCTAMQDIAACLVSSLSLSETTEGMLLLRCRAATTPAVYLHLSGRLRDKSHSPSQLVP